MERDFADVSEVPGLGVSLENARMLATRYSFARKYCEGKDTLEVACGAGMGLGYLASKASKVIGGDYDPRFVEQARAHYGDRLVVDEIDVQDLPYADASFDCVVFMEAIYFVPDGVRALKELRRILRPGGVLVLVSANKEWTLFNPSDRGTRYFTAEEYREILEKEGFQVETYRCFWDKPKGIKGKLLSFARKAVVTLHLIPNTMKGKELMKRLAYGKLVTLPNELSEDFAEYCEPEKCTPGTSLREYKVIYTVAKLS